MLKSIELEAFIKELGNGHYLVPTTEELKWLRLRPDYDFKGYEVYHKGGKPFNAFNCSCKWGTFRLGREEPSLRYCSHVLAVILRKINNGDINKEWLNILYGDLKKE